jgi:hypothetical protein
LSLPPFGIRNLAFLFRGNGTPVRSRQRGERRVKRAIMFQRCAEWARIDFRQMNWINMID